VNGRYHLIGKGTGRNEERVIESESGENGVDPEIEIRSMPVRAWRSGKGEKLSRSSTNQMRVG